MAKDLKNRLTEEILRARERIYHVNSATPFEKARISGIDADVFLKREDLSAINAYKWRGAYNAVAMIPEKKRSRPVIASSAGNHAQGVALAVRILGLKAKIFMPNSAPQMKQNAVKKHGGKHVEVILKGDAYNDAAEAAQAETKKSGGAYIHPFDNLYTIAGQATIADEIVLSGKGPFDYAFIQIGGGGLAAGVSHWLKIHYPGIKVIGVEGEGQASMKASIKAGKLTTLKEVDTFCDGTAVKRPGKLTFKICRDTLDDIITVSNEEVSAAIETSWMIGRFIPEPSGALGLAGLMKYAQKYPKRIKGKKLISLICGANMDFSKLRLISASSAIGAHRRRYLRFAMEEGRGNLLDLIERNFSDVGISSFQYGKVSETKAWPVIAFEADPDKLDKITASLKKKGVKFEDITGAEETHYRIINYNPQMFHNPLFMHVNFPERKGALRGLLRAISPVANVCYFNYIYTGEEIGRALMGFELSEPGKQQEFIARIEKLGITCREINKKTAGRIFYFEG